MGTVYIFLGKWFRGDQILLETTVDEFSMKKVSYLVSRT